MDIKPGAAPEDWHTAMDDVEEQGDLTKELSITQLNSFIEELENINKLQH